MEEWVLLVLGKAGGVPDFKILVQIQVSRWAKEIVEALAHGGLNQMLGPVGRVKLTRQRPAGADPWRAYRLAEFAGIDQMTVGGETERINFFWIHFELPAKSEQQADAAVSAMLGGTGLRLWLGPYCKNVICTRKGETHVGAFEPLQNKIKVQ